MTALAKYAKLESEALQELRERVLLRYGKSLQLGDVG